MIYDSLILAIAMCSAGLSGIAYGHRENFTGTMFLLACVGLCLTVVYG